MWNANIRSCKYPHECCSLNLGLTLGTIFCERPSVPLEVAEPIFLSGNQISLSSPPLSSKHYLTEDQNSICIPNP